MDRELYVLSERCGRWLRARGWMLTAAESCTGGWVAKALTDVPGSSGWFERGFVTYTNRAKQELLGVSASTLERWGAVSEPTVREMVAGALRRSPADVALAVSGIAGPGGGTRDKPVGLVWFAWGRRDAPVHAVAHRFDGDREAVRRQAVRTALEGVMRLA
jgi:nicotinamide-nucleotide amidase